MFKEVLETAWNISMFDHISFFENSQVCTVLFGSDRSPRSHFVCPSVRQKVLSKSLNLYLFLLLGLSQVFKRGLYKVWFRSVSGFQVSLFLPLSILSLLCRTDGAYKILRLVFKRNIMSAPVISHKLQIFRSPGHVTSRDRGTMQGLWESVTWGQRSVTRGSVTAWRGLTSHHNCPLTVSYCWERKQVTLKLRWLALLLTRYLCVWIFALKLPLCSPLRQCRQSSVQCRQHSVSGWWLTESVNKYSIYIKVKMI